MPVHAAGRVVVASGHVVTMDPQLGDLDGADVLIDRGRIAGVGHGLQAEGAERIDASGAIVIPGFVDTHRHMWQAVLRGCGPDHTLDDYFTHVLGTLGLRLSAEDLYLGNLLSALGALDAGVTTVQDTSNINDLPERTDALVQALWDSGLRAVFAYGHGLGDVPGRPAHGGVSQDAIRVRTELLTSDDDLVTMALCVEGCHEDAIRWNWGLAADLDLPVALHCRGGWGTSPVSRLRDLGVLGSRAMFIHGTGLADRELRLIAEHGAALSVAPAIEMVMGHGFPPVAEAVAAGLHPALSVDVETTTGSDMFIQLRAAYQAARFAGQHMRRTETLLTARDVLEFGTIGGARALGMADRIGSITPGKEADLVVLRTDRPGVRPVYDPVGAVVSTMDRGDVDTVIVGGRVVKQGGTLLRADLPSLLERADRVRDRLAGLGLVRG